IPSEPNKPNKMPFLLIVSVLLIILVIVIVVALTHKSTKKAASTTPTTTTTQNVVAGAVDITAKGFSPATIKIKVGQNVVWTNQDSSPHQPATDPYPAENGLAGFDAPA